MLEPTRCSECGQTAQCSYIHYLNDDGEDTHKTYCDMCLLELFKRVHQQMVMSDYVTNMAIMADKIAHGKIDMGKPN